MQISGKYKDSELWQKVEKILAALEENQDIEITTVRDHVIGYFCQELNKIELV